MCLGFWTAGFETGCESARLLSSGCGLVIACFTCLCFIQQLFWGNAGLKLEACDCGLRDLKAGAWHPVEKDCYWFSGVVFGTTAGSWHPSCQEHHG